MASITKLHDTSLSTAERIQQRLDNAGFTEQYLVEAIPLEREKLLNYLSGKELIPAKVLAKIADCLSVNVLWLRGEQKCKY